MTARPVLWQPSPPLPGCVLSSQQLLLSCPYWEALIEGGRGSGKTAGLLMDFAREVRRGYGPYWRGILFRETYKQLDDLVLKSQLLYRRIFPEATWNGSDYYWSWPTGERLILTYMRKPADYWNYHGHEYPWIGWEEIYNWANAECYELMKSCSRSSCPGIPLRIRSNTNSWGKGHAWVKAYWVDPAPAGVPIRDDKTGQSRVRIYAATEENRALHEADKTYLQKLEGIEDENLRRSWRGGADRWNINAGAFFADVWSASAHVLEPFDIPGSWRLDRAFDWGSSRPFSVGWYAVSDGCQVRLRDGKTRTFPRGTLFRVAEWYGWNGKPNEGLRMIAPEIARGILKREREVFPGRLIHPGPADTSIFDTQNGVCIADEMAAAGVRWERADKGPGSRRNGWERCRQVLGAARKFPLEEPGFFVFSTCRHFIRTVPGAVRDEGDPDDIDSEQEDHVLDEWRYRVSARTREKRERDLD